MAASSLSSSFILCLLILTMGRPSSASLAPAQSPNPSAAIDNSTEFIKSSCQSTQNPDLCFSSLARYSFTVHQNHAKLAAIATKESLSQIHSATRLVSAHLRASGSNGEAAALKDCRDSLRDAADQTKQSELEVRKIERLTGSEVAWCVSNAQTWMSAALTNEETCTDGFDTLGWDSAKVDVLDRVGRAKQYTGIALALVDCIPKGKSA